MTHTEPPELRRAREAAGVVNPEGHRARELRRQRSQPWCLSETVSPSTQERLRRSVNSGPCHLGLFQGKARGSPHLQSKMHLQISDTETHVLLPLVRRKPQPALRPTHLWPAHSQLHQSCIRGCSHPGLQHTCLIPRQARPVLQGPHGPSSLPQTQPPALSPSSEPKVPNLCAHELGRKQTS